MKKNKKLILGIVAAFAFLIAVYLWITMYNPTVDNNTLPEITNDQVVYSTKDVIESVQIKNNHGTFTVISGDAGYFLDENNQIILDQTTTSNIFAYCRNITSIVPALENPQELSVYGLASPSSVITVKTEKDSMVFYVGDKLSGNNGYFFKLADTDEIYVLPSSMGNLFVSGIDALRNMSIISTPTDSITKLEIINGSNKLTVEKIVDEENDAYTWVIPSYMNKTADAESVTNKLLIPAANIVASGIAEDNPSDYSKYNLNISVTVWTGDSSYTYIGGVGESNTYARISGLPTVYTVSTGVFAFADTTAFDILERYAYLVYLDDIDSADVTLPSGKYSMKVHRQGDDESYTVNGKSVEKQKFRETYQTLVAMYVDGITSDADTSKSVATITFNYSDGRKLTVGIHEYDSLNYAVSENGKCLFYMKKQNLEDIEKAFAKL